MKRIILYALAALSVLAGCSSPSQKGSDKLCDVEVKPESVLPITGTFINLPYQDVRNKYTNPPHIDNTDPQMWAAKIAEMKKMGMEYLVFMSVANERKAYYPSKLMDWHYPEWRKSPVDAVMDAAAEHGMKVFMSTGWAKDQDDNLRDPKIKGRQLEMMEELAGLYGDHPAFYGWYLPVEDCLGPVLTDYAVEAVNALTARARKLTPSAKILISPYGIFNSDFDDPRYEQQLSRLEVDIIAYQDEVGCVRERYPLTRLRENWKKLRAIHDRTGVEMWANCETFAWEKGTNDRSSALVPAPYGRILAQQVAASAGGAEKIISFIMCGLFEDPSSPYKLGQPHWSAKAYEDYMAWLGGDTYWKLMEKCMCGHIAGPGYLVYRPGGEDYLIDRRLCDGKFATEDAGDDLWSGFKAGKNEICVEFGNFKHVSDVMLRMLNSTKDGIVPPSKIWLWNSHGGDDDAYDLIRIIDVPVFPNTRHDAFVDMILFDDLDLESRMLKIEFFSEEEVYIDEITVNVK